MSERRKHSIYRDCIIYIWPDLKPLMYSNACTGHMRYTIDMVKQDIDKHRGRFWLTPYGIFLRIELLSQMFAYKLTNAALLAYGEAAGLWVWMWLATMDEKTCPLCKARHLKTYKLGGSDPQPPAHPHCRCVAVLLA